VAALEITGDSRLFSVVTGVEDEGRDFIKNEEWKG
jgi:hypothetical protein